MGRAARRVLGCQTAFRVRSRAPIVLRKEHLGQVFALRGRIEECFKFELRHVEVEVDLVRGRELDSQRMAGSVVPESRYGGRSDLDPLHWFRLSGVEGDQHGIRGHAVRLG